MRIIVAGRAGLLRSHSCERLVEHNNEVDVFDSMRLK